MQDQGRKADALSWMLLEVGIKIRKDLVPVCAKNAELDYGCFSNNIIHDG